MAIKRLVALILVAGMASCAGAQMLAVGTQELGLSGQVDFDTPDGTLMHADVTYGYFLWDYTELLGTIGFRDSDHYTVWSGGVAAQYNFDLGGYVVPYSGGGLRLAHYDTEYWDGARKRSDDGVALILGLEGGLKFFIDNNIAISGALVLEVATEDIYPEDDGFSKTDARIEFGLRYFFY